MKYVYESDAAIIANRESVVKKNAAILQDFNNCRRWVFYRETTQNCRYIRV
jgi:hypothetical protein